jgi:hypothetical protein
LSLDRAVQAAEAGVRISLHEPVPDSTAQLEMDFIGSDVGRLAALHPDPADLQFTQTDFAAFDDLRRRSVRGDVLASAVGAHLAPDVASQGTIAFHQAFAEKISYRPGHISVLLSAPGPLGVTLSLVDAAGRRLGGVLAGKVIKEIPLICCRSWTRGARRADDLLAAPEAGEFHRFTPVAGSPLALRSARRSRRSGRPSCRIPVSPRCARNRRSARRRTALLICRRSGRGRCRRSTMRRSSPRAARLGAAAGGEGRAGVRRPGRNEGVELVSGAARSADCRRALQRRGHPKARSCRGRDIANFTVGGTSGRRRSTVAGRFALRDPIGPFVPRRSRPERGGGHGRR